MLKINDKKRGSYLLGDDLKYEENLKEEDDLKCEGNLKYKDDLKLKCNLKYEDDLNTTWILEGG